MNDEKEETRTEQLISSVRDLYIAGVDPNLIYKILVGDSVTPQKAQVIMRWGMMQAKELGWL